MPCGSLTERPDKYTFPSGRGCHYPKLNKQRKAPIAIKATGFAVSAVPVCRISSSQGAPRFPHNRRPPQRGKWQSAPSPPVGPQCSSLLATPRAPRVSWRMGTFLLGKRSGVPQNQKGLLAGATWKVNQPKKQQLGWSTTTFKMLNLRHLLPWPGGSNKFLSAGLSFELDSS